MFKNVAAGAAIFLVVSYAAYMIGLIFVLRRLHRLSWQAFVPLLNYLAQIKAIHAPSRWFFLSLPPYLGAVYVAAVAIRLGRVFGRTPAFSLTWLTLGAPVGMWLLAFGKNNPDVAVLAEPAVLIDTKKLKTKRRPAGQN